MPDVLNRTTKQIRRSVDVTEGNYPETEWIWSPDLSAVDGWVNKYWIIEAYPGVSITLADQATRDQIDADEAAADAAAKTSAAKERYDAEDVFKALAVLIVDELNILRAEHALTPRTYAQARTAIFNALDGGV